MNKEREWEKSFMSPLLTDFFKIKGVYFIKQMKMSRSTSDNVCDQIK